MGRTAKYKGIFDTLREQLAAGTYRVGDRIPSENQLALRFEVSRPTAARALRELEAAGLVERQAGSGTYVRRTRPVGEKGSKSFGLLIQGLGATEIFDPICTEITRVCQEEESVVLWGHADRPSDDVSEIESLCHYYVERRVDGIFFAPPESSTTREDDNLRIASALREAGIAVVLLDRDLLDFPRRSEFDLVGVDNFQAGMRATEHLIDVGHKRISFVSGDHHPSTTGYRAAGWRAALQRAGLETSDAFPHAGDLSDEAFVRGLVDRTTPDAVVCANDHAASLLLVTLAHLGIQVPQDIAVVGFDDVRSSTLLGLTTMRQPYRGIARVAVQAIHDRLREPDLDARQLLLTAELVVRQSSGRDQVAELEAIVTETTSTDDQAFARAEVGHV